MKNKHVTALVDLDPLVYAAGFSAEEHHYILHWVDVAPDLDPANDVEKFATFTAAWRRDAFIETMNLDPEEYISHVQVIPHPEAHALHIINDWMERIKLASQGFLTSHGSTLTKVEGFLTGKSNFRDVVATIKPYKGNRDRSKRPYWYSSIRRHLIEQFGAKVTEGYEADDAIAMRQWNSEDYGDSIICTIDKDLRMVPGLHYNYGRMTSAVVTATEAMHTFWLQVLTGDASDNIPGLHLIGPGKASKILPNYTTPKAAYRAVLAAYEANIARYPEKHLPHTTAEASLLENARLLWMMTHEDELWAPPGTPAQSLREWLATAAPIQDTDEEWL